MQLHELIKADDAALLDKNNWFTVENLQFETNSAKLKAGSETQLKNLYEVLNCYNTLDLKLGGYTDNSGDSLSNVKLSMQRAESAKAALVKMGINPARLSAEGYGPQFPVANNATSPGRAQNRRIDVRVTKK